MFNPVEDDVRQVKRYFQAYLEGWMTKGEVYHFVVGLDFENSWFANNPAWFPLESHEECMIVEGTRVSSTVVDKYPLIAAMVHDFEMAVWELSDSRERGEDLTEEHVREVCKRYVGA